MTGAPLYEALMRQSGRETARFHMPGHKGMPLPGGLFADAAAIDFTELEATGDLYRAGGPIAEAEQLAAEAYGAASCVFLTGGGTQGVYAALAGLTGPGGKLLADRNSHQSVHNAMALLDLRPQYIKPAHIPDFGVTGGISPFTLWEALSNTETPDAIIVTSPTYYGVLLDIAGLARVARDAAVPLIVDAAHGAHLPFIGHNSSIAQGATVEICSGHKTLPVFGQGAYLFGAANIDGGALRHHASIFGTSSPSYLVMASLDLARRHMQTLGAAEYFTAAETAGLIRDGVNERGVFLALTEYDAGLAGGAGIDECRLTVCTGYSGLSGLDAAGILDQTFGIVPELADRCNVVFIITGADNIIPLERLNRALQALENAVAAPSRMRIEPAAHPPLPTITASPREAMFAPKERTVLAAAAGKTAGQPVTPYPPGVPVVTLGEKIDSAHIAFLEKMCYNISEEILTIK